MSGNKKQSRSYGTWSVWCVEDAFPEYVSDLACWPIGEPCENYGGGQRHGRAADLDLKVEHLIAEGELIKIKPTLQSLRRVDESTLLLKAATVWLFGKS